ncbi:MAG: aldo/keto reductase, partial [Deltaproteobacteria bacterium]|nr:aldo/keto reductase [Deltaproteobacteria bacterium]
MDPGEQRPLGRSRVCVSRLGLGGAALGNLYAPVTDADARAAVDAAWRVGVRYFDTAPLYGFGLSERRLGDALRPRDGAVVSTKVGRRLHPSPGREDGGFVDALPFEPRWDYSYDGARRSLDDSLQRLGLDHVDVALVHDIGALTHGPEQHAERFKQALDGAYRALDELRAQGVLGAIGLGVNESEVCAELLAHADPDCFLLAGRYTLLEQTPLDSLLPLCAERGVSLVVGGPYNSGLLAASPAAGGTYDYQRAPPEILARAQAIDRVCNAHGVALPAAALQFPLLHPQVAAVITGARSAREVEQNAERMRAPIPPALWADLREGGWLH